MGRSMVVRKGSCRGGEGEPGEPGNEFVEHLEE